MASNPRKFSEKIALHNQKQAEETAAFEQIMKEVGSAKTPKNGVRNSSHTQHLAIGTILTSKGGSLPNVNSPSSNATTIDLQSALSNLEDMRMGRDSGYRDRRSAGPGGGGFSPSSRSRPIETSRRMDPASPSHPYSIHPVNNMGPPMASSMGGGNSMTSVPMATTIGYLSPPSDTWRRTHSDSALHQAVMAPGDTGLHGSGNSPTIPRRLPDGISLVGSQDPMNSANLVLGVPVDGRPKSCCDVSRVPGINICPGPDPNGLQIPIGNNTGSLPDLTNLQFTSPLPNPLDSEDASAHRDIPYITSQQIGSPNMVGGLSNMHQMNTVNTVSIGSLSPGNLNSRGSNPGPSPTARRRPHHQLQNLVLGSSPRPYHGHSNHNASPGIALDTSGISVPSYQPFLYQGQGQHSSGTATDFAQPLSPAHSPTHMMSPSQPIPSHGSLLSAYGNTHSLLKPSPQSSPTLCVPGSMNYRSGSPGDANSVSSAPPSPVSQSLSPASSPGLAPSPASPFTDVAAASLNTQNQNQIPGSGNVATASFYQNQTNVLHQFENFTMMDTCTHQNLPSYGDYKTNSYEQTNLPMDISLESYYSPHLLFRPSHGNGTQQTTPQTPQTPSSIPDIVLQDFSSTSDDLVRQGLAKDLSSAMTASFEGVDFLPTDDALRAGLDPIDLDGLQMLTDATSLVTDPSTEDHFRLDRL